MADQGLLHIEDADRAAIHLMLLISVSNPSYRGDTPSGEEISEMVVSGVRAFLHGYVCSRL